MNYVEKNSFGLEGQGIRVGARKKEAVKRSQDTHRTLHMMWGPGWWDLVFPHGEHRWQKCSVIYRFLACLSLWSCSWFTLYCHNDYYKWKKREFLSSFQGEISFLPDDHE